MQSLKELSIGPHGEKESSQVNSETSNLIWVPIKGTQIPNNTVSIYNDYSSRLEYVCRAKDYCTFGFLTLAKGFFCYFPFLEQDNFVGKNKYGLGDIYKGHFYLPWKWELYRYSHYDVLTVNREPFKMQYSDVTYFIDQANRTNSPPYAMKMSKVINEGTEEVMENVRIEVMTEKSSQWECGLDLSLSTSTSITAGIPDIFSDKITVCVDVTVSLAYGRSKSQAVTQSQEVSVRVPPGHSCVVKMIGRKMEVEIPFQASVTKTYQDGTVQQSTVSGVYTGVQVGEVIVEVDACDPLGTTTQKA
ncbi:natterin-4-like [Sardina pilchardus]|uniref:natterin-4-like n=1 Tax=Sardina pilchardus TaxID=27697 RepID=UPI002E14BD3C